MRKLFALFLALVMVLSISACGGGGGETPSNDGKTPGSSQQQQQNTPDPDPAEDEGGGEANAADGHFNFGDATVDDWAQKLEEQLGVTIPLPDGWSVSKVEGTDWNKDMASEGKMYVYFDCPDTTNDDAAGTQAIKDFLSCVFDAMKSKATGNIVGGYDTSKTFDSLPEIADLFRIRPADCSYYVPLEVSEQVTFEWSVVWNKGNAEEVYLLFGPK